MIELFGYENATVADTDFIVERLQALRRMTHETGFRTNRSQTLILGKLKPEALAEVVLKLHHAGDGSQR